jgi:hypothetical protein
MLVFLLKLVQSVVLQSFCFDALTLMISPIVANTHPDFIGRSKANSGAGLVLVLQNLTLSKKY